MPTFFWRSAGSLLPLPKRLFIFSSSVVSRRFTSCGVGSTGGATSSKSTWTADALRRHVQCVTFTGNHFPHNYGCTAPRNYMWEESGNYHLPQTLSEFPIQALRGHVRTGAGHGCSWPLSGSSYDSPPQKLKSGNFPLFSLPHHFSTKLKSGNSHCVPGECHTLPAPTCESSSRGGFRTWRRGDFRI